MIVANTSGATVVAPGGNVWHVPDPGIPLTNYTPASSDPANIWRTQPSVRKVVGFAAREIAQLPWHAYQRRGDGDRVRLRDSAAERLMRDPGRFVGGYQLIEALVIDAMMYDRFAAFLWDGELVRIPPARWTVHSDWLGRVTQIRLLTPAGQDDIDITDWPLVVGWGWSEHAAGGISPMVTLAELLDENRQSVEWRKRHWDWAPRFGGLLKHPGSFKTSEKRDRFAQDWRDWIEGRKGTPILEDGMDYVQAPTITPEQARDIEGRQLTDAEVCGAFHIPPELVGVRPGNFSNMVALRSMLFGPTLGPTIKQLAQALNRLVPFLESDPDIYLEAAREEAINGSLMEQAQVLQTMTGGPIMTRAEARARLNLARIEGTDELIVPMNVTEGGQASPTDSGSQNRRLGLPSTLGRVAKATGDQEQRGDPEADKVRRDLERALEQALEEQAEDLAAGTLDVDAFVEKWTPRTAAALLPGLKAAARLAAGRILAEHPVDDWDYDVMDGYLEAMAETTGGKVAAGSAETYAAEDDPATALDLVKAGAVTWAATAAAEALGFGGHDAAKAAGLGTKTWVVTSSNPRSSHAAMNGETVGIDELFSNGAKWPGDPSLDVDETAGCTCEVTYNR